MLLSYKYFINASSLTSVPETLFLYSLITNHGKTHGSNAPFSVKTRFSWCPSDHLNISHKFIGCTPFTLLCSFTSLPFHYKMIAIFGSSHDLSLTNNCLHFPIYRSRLPSLFNRWKFVHPFFLIIKWTRVIVENTEAVDLLCAFLALSAPFSHYPTSTL